MFTSVNADLHRQLVIAHREDLARQSHNARLAREIRLARRQRRRARRHRRREAS